MTVEPHTFRIRARDERGLETGEILEHTAYPLTLEDLQQLEPWIQSQMPDPFAVARKAIAEGDYTVMQQQFLMDKAMVRATDAPPKVGTPEGDRILGSLEGVKKMLVLSIRKGRPEFSDDEASKLFSSMSMAETMRLHESIIPTVLPAAAEQAEPGPQPAAGGSRKRRRGKPARR